MQKTSFRWRSYHCPSRRVDGTVDESLQDLKGDRNSVGDSEQVEGVLRELMLAIYIIHCRLPDTVPIDRVMPLALPRRRNFCGHV
jgi:hypothetical protein